MFPHPCGQQFVDAVNQGIDPKSVVPDNYVIVRGGIKPIPSAGTIFSGVAGPTLEAASCAVPNNQIRATTAAEIRGTGGTIEWRPEYSPRGTMNLQHVNVTENGPTVFSDPMPNPVLKRDRIDQGR